MVRMRQSSRARFETERRVLQSDSSVEQKECEKALVKQKEATCGDERVFCVSVCCAFFPPPYRDGQRAGCDKPAPDR